MYMRDDVYKVLGMHDHIEEMGRYIVRRDHPDEPNKHSHLWIEEEIEDILTHDKGTEKTRCLKLETSRRNSRIVMKGLEKMERLKYLEVNYEYESDGDFRRSYPKSDYTNQLDESTQYFPESLEYLGCSNYPFLYLPETFQANNLVGLDMKSSERLVHLWEKRDGKVLEKLKFLSLTYSKLRSFDLGLTPNIETLSLSDCSGLLKLQVSSSVAYPNLKYLNLSRSSLSSLDLALIPNLESLVLERCCILIEINAPVKCLKKLVRLNLLGCTNFKKLPEDLGRLGCLKNLNITSTGISHLPQSIFGLKGLLIIASSELLGHYKFPSEIRTTTWW